MSKVYIISNANMKAVLFDDGELLKMQNDFNFSAETTFDTIESASNEIANMKTGKFYAVKNGKVNGVYFDWNTCKSMVSNVANAQYKSFTTFDEAIIYMSLDSKPKVVNDSKNPEKELSEPYAYVDGSYNAATSTYGYGVVLVDGDNVYEFSGSGSDAEMASMRNVAGEVLGSQRAITEAIAMGLNSIVVHYDYQGIECWANGSWKRNKNGTIAYYDFIQNAKDLIDIKFVKVKAHSGVELNEKVDKLAKEAVGI
jgi:ribonuclease HI